MRKSSLNKSFKKSHLITLLVATLLGAAVSAAFSTDANACPGGYVRCGGACCPGR